ncbi:MAG: hypothetical protein EOM50_24470 [Erysipelotrichia bacterium]|nr:hypothetical protein [Erysipelotrichia bacterium]
MQYTELKKYAENGTLTNEKMKIIQHNIDSIGIRINVVEKRHLWDWVILYTKYNDCYPRRKGLYLDLYIAVLNKYKGAN